MAFLEAKSLSKTASSVLTSGGAGGPVDGNIGSELACTSALVATLAESLTSLASF